MIPRIILLGIGVSLLVGCGRSDHPTIRQTTIARDEPSPTPAARPPQDAETAHSEPAAAPVARPDLESGAHSHSAEKPHPDSPDVPDSKATEAEPSRENAAAPAKVGDTPPPPTVAATAPPSPGATDSASGSLGTPVPKMDATAPANPSRPAASLYADGRASPSTGVPAPPKAAIQENAEADSRDVRFGGICLAAPQGWTRERPPLKFILAEFSLPRSKGDSSDAQLTVTLAVKNDAKGLARLRDQLKEEEQSQESVIQKLTIGGHEVVVVESSGVDDEEPSAASQGRYRALNAMVFLGESVYFVNCSGPEKTVAERAGEFRAFLETMKAVE